MFRAVRRGGALLEGRMCLRRFGMEFDRKEPSVETIRCRTALFPVFFVHFGDCGQLGVAVARRADCHEVHFGPM